MGLEIFSETGRSYQEAYDKILTKYGPNFMVLNKKTVSYGGFLGLFSKEGVEITGYVKQAVIVPKKTNLHEEKSKILQLAEDRGVKVDRVDTINQVLNEVKSLKDHLKDFSPATNQEHQGLAEIREILENNDFSSEYIAQALSYLRRELSMEDMEDSHLLQKTLFEYICDSIPVYEHIPKVGQRFVLVGPTGVGKTTTIAKLAATHGIGENGSRKKNVALITIDNYRIGAKVQIESYGEIMEFPVYDANSFDTLDSALARCSAAEMIFVDTIGKNPRDFMKLAEMKEILDATGTKGSYHLAFSCTTKTSDIREIMNQFEPFRYESLVMTKLDETTLVGNLISLIWEKKKPVSYVTDGQRVPQDIHRANKKILVSNLTGFDIDVKKYPIPGEEE